MRTPCYTVSTYCSLFVLLLAFCACSSSRDELTDSSYTPSNQTVDQKSDGESLTKNTTTQFRLISSYSYCQVYPVTSTAFVTLASCVAECKEDVGCESAVMTYNETTQQEEKLLGLVNHRSVHPFYKKIEQQAIQSYGEDAWLYLHGYDVAVIHLPKAHEYNTEDISKSMLDFLEGDIFLDNDAVSMKDWFTSGLVVNASQTHCMDGRGLFNEEGLLHALSLLNGKNDHCMMQRLDVHYRFIQEAIRKGNQQEYTVYGDLDPMPDDLKTLLKVEDDPNHTEDDDSYNPEQYELEEEEALRRAPNTCSSQEDDYCDGNVEMRCVGGSYRAFSCTQVGWFCVDSDSEASCNP